jgi:hypothetical protein
MITNVVPSLNNFGDMELKFSLIWKGAFIERIIFIGKQIESFHFTFYVA